MKNIEILHPSKMKVAFGLFDKDDLLCRGTITVDKEKTIDRFPPLGQTITEDPFFIGLVIEHMFGLPASSLVLQYFAATPDISNKEQGPTEIFVAALQMGVHLSTDWECIDLNGFDFCFKCEPLGKV